MVPNKSIVISITKWQLFLSLSLPLVFVHDCMSIIATVTVQLCCFPCSRTLSRNISVFVSGLAPPTEECLL